MNSTEVILKTLDTRSTTTARQNSASKATTNVIIIFDRQRTWIRLDNDNVLYYLYYLRICSPMAHDIVGNVREYILI